METDPHPLHLKLRDANDEFRQGGVGSCAARRVVVQESSAVYHAELYVQQVSRGRHEFELAEMLYIIRTAFKDSAVASTESRVDSVNSVIWARTRFVRLEVEGSTSKGTDRISSLLRELCKVFPLLIPPVRRVLTPCTWSRRIHSWTGRRHVINHLRHFASVLWPLPLPLPHYCG